jgi:hypothetical protein
MLSRVFMDSDKQPVVDWVNLPDDIPALSLWETLHDGDLLAIESDLLDRTVTLRFDVGYVRDFHEMSADTRFVVVIRGVQSVRSFRTVPWPGGCPIPQGMPNIKQAALIAEYHRKWREESQSWSDLERLTTDPYGLEVSVATLGRGSDVVALQLGLFAQRDSYVEAYIRGEGITFNVGEKEVTIEEFVAFGHAYWEAFAKRGKTD